MSTRKDRLIEVYDHLRNFFGVHTKKDLAVAINMTQPALYSAFGGNEDYLTDSLFRRICAAYPDTFNIDYLLTGEGDFLIEEQDHKSSSIQKQQEIPEYVQRLFDEAVKMSTRNEMLERQCESLIAELRDSKSKNETFLSELRKSKEDNDALVADLKISRVQNKELISELRETKKNNGLLATKLEAAIEGIEGMKSQLAMMAGSYVTPQPPVFTSMFVNDDPGSSLPEGLIRGGYQVFTEEICKSANKALDSKPNRV